MVASALESITIEGFRSIAAIDHLRLTPINVVIGANGSGKSNFIETFSFLQAIRDGRLRNYVTAAGGAEKLLHFGSKTTKRIYFYLSFERGTNEYRLELRPTADDGLFPSSENVAFWDGVRLDPLWRPLGPREEGREAGVSDPSADRIAKWVRERLGGWRVYHFNDTGQSSPMRKTCSVDDVRFLRADGSNLAAFLLRVREDEADTYELIRQCVRIAAPFFDDFILVPLARNPETIKLEWRHRGSDQYFDASSLSDGTLRFIALATLFLQPGAFRPSTIVVDEPELGLHPAAIGLLAGLIKQAATRNQVIVSTQSSLLLDQFEPEDVLVAERVDGGTVLKRLEAERLRGWLEDYSLGQLWEKNELGGRPVAG
jgi:predicted ATPase